MLGHHLRCHHSESGLVAWAPSEMPWSRLLAGRLTLLLVELQLLGASHKFSHENICPTFPNSKSILSHYTGWFMRLLGTKYFHTSNFGRSYIVTLVVLLPLQAHWPPWGVLRRSNCECTSPTSALVLGYQHTTISAKEARGEVCILDLPRPSNSFE